MSLQDEINKLKAEDPRNAITTFLLTQKNATISRTAEETYQKICKTLAEEQVYGTKKDHSVIVSFETNILFDCSFKEIEEKLMLGSGSVKVYEITETITDLKYDSYDHYNINLAFAVRNNQKSYYSGYRLTETGEILIDLLSNLCAQDKITISVQVCYSVQQNNGKYKDVMLPLGKNLFHSLLSNNRPVIDRRGLIIHFN